MQNSCKISNYSARFCCWEDLNLIVYIHLVNVSENAVLGSNPGYMSIRYHHMCLTKHVYGYITQLFHESKVHGANIAFLISSLDVEYFLHNPILAIVTFY